MKYVNLSRACSKIHGGEKIKNRENLTPLMTLPKIHVIP